MKPKKNKKPTPKKVFNVQFIADETAELLPMDKLNFRIWEPNNAMRFIVVFMLAAIIPLLTMYYDDFFNNPVFNSFVGLYVYLLLFSVIIQLQIHRRVYGLVGKGAESYFMLKSANKYLGARVFFFPIPFIFYYIYYKYLLTRLKNMKILCPMCKTWAQPASNEMELSILSPVKQFEKKIGSIDHKVFQCMNLHKLIVPFFGKKSSSYTNCASCGAKAVKQTGDKIIRHATYSSAGQGQKEFTCQYCSQKTYKTYTIPKKTRSSSGGGFGSSRGSSWSGGGSWGGGRTGGGGAGGKW